MQKWFQLESKNKRRNGKSHPMQKIALLPPRFLIESSSCQVKASNIYWMPILSRKSCTMCNDLCLVDYWCTWEESLHTCLRNRCKVLWLHHPAYRTSFLFTYFDWVSWLSCYNLQKFLSFFLVLSFCVCYLLCTHCLVWKISFSFFKSLHFEILTQICLHWNKLECWGFLHHSFYQIVAFFVCAATIVTM